MLLRPGAICHDDVDLAADPGVEGGEELPVDFLCFAPEPLFAEAGVPAAATWGVFVVQAGEHVRGNGGVVYVCSCRYGRKEPLGQRKREGITRGVDENVRD